MVQKTEYIQNAPDILWLKQTMLSTVQQGETNRMTDLVCCCCCCFCVLFVLCFCGGFNAFVVPRSKAMSRLGSLDSLSYNIQLDQNNLMYFMQYKQIIEKRTYVHCFIGIYNIVNMLQ